MIHQALHGYSEGHRMISSSIQLTKSSERELSILTDLSGSTGGEPFETYLTGYPLPNTNIYAFSCTWPAPEMPRPGCVWTHTLLVDRDNLTAVGIENLHQLFRRPQDPDERTTYSEPIVPRRLLSPTPTLPPHSHLATILGALYAEKAKPAAFVIDSPHEIEGDLLMVWSQQWPSLASSFKFCTGAINPRRINGKSFDLQFIPRHFFRSSRWKDTSILLNDRMEPVHQRPTWIDVAIEDMYVRDGPSKLKEFLSLMGDDLGQDRSVFGALVNVFAGTQRLSSTGGSVEEVVNVVAGAFPGERQARELKRVLFGPLTTRQTSLLGDREEGEILGALLGSRAFDSGELEVRKRAKESWQQGALTWALLQTAHSMQTESAVAKDILAGIALAIDAHDLRRATKTEGLLDKLVELRPALLEMPEAWQGSVDEQRRFGEVLSSRFGRDVAFDEVVRAMWKVNSNAAARDVIMTGGSMAVSTVLDLIQHGGGDDSGHERSTRNWFHALQSQPQAVIMWLKAASELTRASLQALSKVLDPLDADVQRVDSGVWVRALRDTSFRKLDRDRGVAMFILIAGLTKEDSSSDELICLSFDSVHKAILDGKLSNRWWDRLQSVLEELPWWRRWDRAEALRLTVVKRCVGTEWPARSFLRLAEERRRLALLVRTVRTLPDGQEYLTMVCKDTASHPGREPKWKTKSLSKGLKTEEESLL